MKIVFVSNYLNHHQKPLADKLYELTAGGFLFIQTEEVAQERRKLGWHDDYSEPYLIVYQREPERCRKQIEMADAVVIGGSSDEYIRERLRSNGLIFRYEETIFKNGWKDLLQPGKWKMLWVCHFRYRKNSVYMLCASGNAAKEFRRLGLYRGKMFRWGYFPVKIAYDVPKLMEGKEKSVPEILWCARFIWWKHPEKMVELARKLKNQGILFHCTMLGTGELYDRTAETVRREGLEELVSLPGSTSPEEVRECMRTADIFLATSGREEGWGAVVNEAMNAGCAVVANKSMGAAPYLIEDGVDGYVYGTDDEMYSVVRDLCADPAKRGKVGAAAYDKIADLWNSDVAAERLIRQVRAQTAGEPVPVYREGPCSQA